ncbi:MAG: hypothetical protein AVDCRST_MAG14-1689, partial [uncultured Rubrobacteraceae bacterium]
GRDKVAAIAARLSTERADEGYRRDLSEEVLREGAMAAPWL